MRKIRMLLWSCCINDFDTKVLFLQGLILNINSFLCKKVRQSVCWLKSHETFPTTHSNFIYGVPFSETDAKFKWSLATSEVREKSKFNQCKTSVW